MTVSAPADHPAPTSTGTTTTPKATYFYPISGGAKPGDIDNGVDFEGGYPSNLIAISDGVIVNIQGEFPGGSIVLKMDHPYHGHYFVYYGHLDHSEPGCVAVSKGQRVAGGSVIGHTSRVPVCDGGCPSGHTEIGFARDESGVIQTGGPFAGDRTKGTSWGALFHKFLGEIKNHTAASSTATNDGTGAASLDQLASVAQATAFATELEFPSIEEMAEAVGLQGQKSLLNDKPLLSFIQQLSTASLRQFMSMPNGNIFFFFPDYFGEAHHRAPYWEIDDIEVLEGKIELSDDALATHVYVVGDTTMTGQEPLNALASRGTITIQNAFQGDVIVNTKDPKQAKGDGFDTLVEAHEALQFLQRYGARPFVEDMPMIHSSFFEMFFAYQKFMQLWSRQFITQFTFTFMPELFPGGKVGFPQHALQMYIEEVEHSFDYESGFVTQATLSSPSVYVGPNTPKEAVSNLPPNMVRALIEPSKNVTGIPNPKPQVPGAPTSNAGSPGNVRAGR